MFVPMFLMLSATFAGADEVKSGALLQTLPKDGQWASYLIQINGDGKDLSLNWKLRSVGTCFHEGKPCRYLELEQICENGSQEVYGYSLASTVWRSVIPEAAFGKDKNPFESAVKIWIQKDPQPATVVDSIDVQDPILASIIRGPSNNLKVEDKTETIVWQKGELPCRVVCGTRELQFAGYKVEFISRVLRNDSIPFTVAGIRQELKVSLGAVEYKVSIKADLRDHGSGAEPKLPQLTP